MSLAGLNDGGCDVNRRPLFIWGGGVGRMGSVLSARLHGLLPESFDGNPYVLVGRLFLFPGRFRGQMALLAWTGRYYSNLI